MHERNGQPQAQPTPTPEPDLTPRPNPILAQPATPATCRQDYEAATDVRHTLATQETRARR
ncbi:hypothetical protein [Streptomyces sp. bgisy154]|uniref:hypothetical protein n=1 Tax=Streptomyces sp. bgisy154 TaxID=3413794 RepID=UPI003D72B018